MFCILSAGREKPAPDIQHLAETGMCSINFDRLGTATVEAHISSHETH